MLFGDVRQAAYLIAIEQCHNRSVLRTSGILGIPRVAKVVLEEVGSAASVCGYMTKTVDILNIGFDCGFSGLVTGSPGSPAFFAWLRLC